VVVQIPQVWSCAAREHRVAGSGEVRDEFPHRPDASPEHEHLVPESVDPLEDARSVALEDVRLEFPDPVRHPLQSSEISVYDCIHEGVEQVVRLEPPKPRAASLHPLYHGVEERGVPLLERNEHAGFQEQGEVTVLRGISGAWDDGVAGDEHARVVDLGFWPVVAVEGVLHPERMDAEACADTLDGRQVGEASNAQPPDGPCRIVRGDRSGFEPLAGIVSTLVPAQQGDAGRLRLKLPAAGERAGGEALPAAEALERPRHPNLPPSAQGPSTPPVGRIRPSGRRSQVPPPRAGARSRSGLRSCSYIPPDDPCGDGDDAGARRRIWKAERRKSPVPPP